MIKTYMNQSLTWKHVTGNNGYNEPSYATSTIKGRIEQGHKLIRNKQGQETVATARVFTMSAVEVNDKIDDRLVISVESAVGLSGNIEYYTVFLI